MARVTPLLGAKGTFTVRAPFVLAEGVVYEAAAIRSIHELRSLDVDPFVRIYQANGLSESDYRSDLTEGAAIVTLMAPSQAPVYIPDTYITGVPDADAVPYCHLIVSASLGAMPRDYDTVLVEAAVAGVISDYIGVTPTVRIVQGPYNGIVTYSQHQTLQTARQAAVTNRETDRARALRLEQENIELRAHIQQLEQLLIAQTTP